MATPDLFVPQEGGTNPQNGDNIDEDDLSVTSTNLGDDDAEKEWFVDDVLAERPNPDDPDVVQYLIKWEEFGYEHCTWEPPENLGGGLLPEWEEKKDKIARGEDIPFDLDIFFKAVEEQKDRHKRRNAKRARLGLDLTPPFPSDHSDESPVDSPIEQDSSESDVELLKVAKVTKVTSPKPKSKLKSKSPASSVSSPSHTPAPTHGSAKPKAVVDDPPRPSPQLSPALTQDRAEQSPKSPKPPKPSKPPVSSKPTNTKKVPSGPSASTASSSAAKENAPMRKASSSTSAVYQGTARKSSIFRTSAGGVKLPMRTQNSSTTGPGSANGMKGKGLKATRTSQQPSTTATTSNIFLSGKIRKKRKNLGEAMVDTTKAPKQFSNMRLQNLAKKRSIEKADAVGSLASIPSRFIIGNEPQPKRKTSITDDAGQTSTMTDRPSPSDANTPADPPSPPQKRRKAVRFTEGDDLETVFESAPDTHAESDISETRNPTQSNTAAGVSQSPDATHMIRKSVKFGESEVLVTQFTGINRGTAWFPSFQEHTVLNFDATCTTFHFLSQLGSLVGERFAAGIIQPDSQDEERSINNVAEWLRRDMIALHLIAPAYSILVYPGQCTGWAKLHDNGVMPMPWVPLRYLMYRSATVSNLRVYPSLNDLNAENLDREYPPNSGNLSHLITKLSGLNFHKMVPQIPGDKNKQVYMLLIPLKHEQLVTLLKVWLRSNLPECSVFSLDQPTSWSAFHKAVKAGSGGTIICHTDMTVEKLSTIPRISDMLENAKYTFWDLNTGENNPPPFPSYLQAEVGPAKLCLTRLFPTGRAFLITPSFVLSDPARLVEFLKWFKNTADRNTPRIIIVACFHFLQFLKDITVEKERERALLYRDHSHLPNLHRILDETGRGQQDLEHHQKAYELLQEIIVHHGDEDTSEDIRKVFWASEHIDPSDEQSLVNYFCWWSSTKLDLYRRFYVMGSSKTRVARAYRHIPIPRYGDAADSMPEVSAVYALQRSKAVEAKKEAGQPEPNIAWATNVVTVNGQVKLVPPARKSKSEPWFPTAGTHVTSPNIEGLRRWMSIHIHATSFSWSRLYRNPVAWRDNNMAKQFEDGRDFDTFDEWFEERPQPFSTRSNTYFGLFYTITEEWNPDLPKFKYVRHPWIAVLRPKYPHRLSFQPQIDKVELFIWDAGADDRRHDAEGVYLDMQCQLIDFVYKQVPFKLPGCILADVWYGSHTDVVVIAGENVLDVTCHRIEEMFKDGRLSLPPQENILMDMGWKAVDPRLWRKGMSQAPTSQAMDIVAKEVPRNDKDTHKAERSIWHPGPRRMGVSNGPTKCVNELHEACRQARVEDPKCEAIRFDYRPTSEWYADQIAEGRDCTFVHVAAAETILAKLPK
ncbi:hypothetical protein F5Y16DRAFT_382703 [Xylariaceae sp. FL0255]|nr:hypothetical protein F5Y16DRAFT_382703 [Xylariaceae sp. FL0255]